MPLSNASFDIQNCNNYFFTGIPPEMEVEWEAFFHSNFNAHYSTQHDDPHGEANSNHSEPPVAVVEEVVEESDEEEQCAVMVGDENDKKDNEEEVGEPVKGKNRCDEFPCNSEECEVSDNKRLKRQWLRAWLEVSLLGVSIFNFAYQFKRKSAPPI